MMENLSSNKNRLQIEAKFAVGLVIGVILINAIFTSCGPTEEDVQPIPVKDVVFELDEFPLAIGNTYRYQIFEVGTSYIDTLTMEIMDSRDGAFYVELLRWEFFGGRVDSGLFNISQNEILYRGLNTRTDYSYFGDFYLKFPMEVGSKWTGTNPKDSITVISRSDSILVFGERTDDVYFINRVYIDPDLGISLLQNLQIKPGVGILTQSLNLRKVGQVPQQQFFTLIEAELK